MPATIHKPNSGHFPARLLPMLRPFVEFAREMRDPRFAYGNLFIEPAAAGGIHVAAVTGVAMAVIHVPDGYIRRPCVIDVPDDAFDTANSPIEIEMTFEGTTLTYDLPEWTHPGTCYVSDAGIFINPKMRPPQLANEHTFFNPALFQRVSSTNLGSHVVGLDYRMEEKTAPGWRALVQKAMAAPHYADARPMAINPALVALFEATNERITGRNGKPGHFWFRLAGTHEAPEPALVMIENHPEFLGVISPQASAEPHPVPSHFFFPAAIATEVQQ